MTRAFISAVAQYLGRWRWMLWDLLSLYAASALIFWLRMRLGDAPEDILIAPSTYLGALPWMALGWLLLFSVFGLYRRAASGTPTDCLSRVFHAVTFGMFILPFIPFDSTWPLVESRAALVGYWASVLLLMAGGRLMPTLQSAPRTNGDNGRINKRRLAILATDAVGVALAYYLAFWLRFDGDIAHDAYKAFWDTLPLVFLVRVASFTYFRLYSGVWRYASVNDLVSILKAVSVGTVLLVLPVFFFGVDGYPRSVFIIDWFLMVGWLGGSRFALRTLRELTPRFLRRGRRILIIGAGDAGEMVVRELCKNPSGPMLPVAFIDADSQKHGARLHGIPVVGDLDELEAAVDRFHITEVLIAIPSATGSQMRRIVEECGRIGVRFKTVPSLREIIDGGSSVREARNVQVEDILRRSPVDVDPSRVVGWLAGKRVMITGGAGSIGSELARRMLRFAPAEIALVDRAENALHDLLEELARLKSGVRIGGYLADITDRARFHALFADHPPDVLFHAAAYKQVPLSEEFPDAAVLNNVGGSRFLMDWALERGVDTFVNISTDKAVNPYSVMGATKRIAELLALRRAAEEKTRFVSVRFGNVLASDGSVVPLFERQIRAGGPVTVTTPDVTRYFMTAGEAALLLLNAAVIGLNGQMLVLDMGEPVRIFDLARDLIILNGLRPEDDIPIVFTGLRPGEKTTEDLFGEGVQPRPSGHDKIWIVDAIDDAPDDFESRVTELLTSARSGHVRRTMAILANLVPGYQQPATLPTTPGPMDTVQLSGDEEAADRVAM